jgi:hypothetical protein
MGGHIVSRDDPQSPGSDGASPYQRWGLPRYLWRLPPIGLVNQSSQEFMRGHVASQDDGASPLLVENYGNFQNCVRRGSNPQPSAPEADALSS